MNNEVAKINPAHKVGAVESLAARYSMNANDFAVTLRETVFKDANDAQFVALAVVANEYRLNPLTKEIYAFPAKGGGIVPIVSIDGWIRLINERKELDGFEFQDAFDEKGKLVSCTCTMYRKDRTHPVKVTEYLSECKRSTDPWKMEHRMLRHKTLIQTARYAFGFSGIYEPDEAERIQDVEQSNSSSSLQPPTPPKTENQDSADNGPAQSMEAEAPEEPSIPSISKDGESGASNSSDGDTRPAPSEEAAVEEDGANTSSTDGQDETIDVKGMIDNFESQAKGVKTLEDLEELWVELDFEARLEGDDMSIDMAKDVKKSQERRINRG